MRYTNLIETLKTVMRGVLPDFAFFSKPGDRWEQSGGIWGKDKLEAARWFLSQATTLRSLQVLKIQFQSKIFPFWREGKMCFSVILLPGPATFTLLPGEKYLISFCYKSCFNFVLEVSSDCASANLGMGGERKEEKRSRYECVRKKLPKKGNGQSIPPAPMLQSCVNIVR